MRALNLTTEHVSPDNYGVLRGEKCSWFIENFAASYQRVRLTPVLRGAENRRYSGVPGRAGHLQAQAGAALKRTYEVVRYSTRALR